MLNGLKDRMLNISSSAKKIILISSASVLVLIAVICTVFVCGKQVVIIDRDGSAKEVITFKRYVGDVLDEEKIILGTSDELNFSEDTKLKDNMKIEIYRAFPILITEKDSTREVRTAKRTVNEALVALGINLKDSDIVTPARDAKITDFSEIKIVRVDEKVVEVVEEIPYEAKERVNNSMASGTKKLVQAGSPGEKMVSYKISYSDGVEVSREKISETVTVEPIAQIREVGAKKPAASNYQIASAGTIQTSRSGNLAYSKVLSVNATAYDASSCGKSPSHPAYGITATGARAGYGVVAVDPRVIPLGSRLYIESADGSYVYGTAVAADTGGAIKGNRIDLCFNTRQEALNFGRRTVKVYVLN